MNKSYIELSKKLLAEAYEMNKGGNVICSPLSLYLLLEIAMNATQGKSQEEIIKVVSDGKNVDAINRLVILRWMLDIAAGNLMQG